MQAIISSARILLRRFGDRRYVKWALASLILLIVVDGVVTNLLIQLDIAHEGNPLLRPLAGSAWLILVKAVGAVVCGLILWDIYRHWPKVGLVSAYGALCVYSLIVIWNISLLITPLF